MALYRVKGDRMYFVDPETSKETDISKIDRSFNFLNDMLYLYGYKRMKIKDLPDDLVLYDRDGLFFKKTGNFIEDEGGRKIACLIKDLYFSFIPDDFKASVLASLLRGLKSYLYNFSGVSEELEIFGLIGYIKYYKVIETDKGIFLNCYLIDSKHLDTITSPIFTRFEFFSFPIFAYGKEVKLALEDVANLQETNSLEEITFKFINAAKEGRKIYAYAADDIPASLKLREIAHTGIEVKDIIKCSKKSNVGPDYIAYIIK